MQHHVSSGQAALDDSGWTLDVTVLHHDSRKSGALMNAANDWRNEFGLEFEVPASIERLTTLDLGIKDLSWHNDACPRFVKSFADNEEVCLWVEHVSVNMREGGDNAPRFVIEDTRTDARWETSDDNEAIALFLAACER